MKIILLVNKSDISPEGIYRINKLHDTFNTKHELVLVQCKDVKQINLKRNFSNKLKNIKSTSIINKFKNKLISAIRYRITNKVKNKFGNFILNKNIAYTRINNNNINSVEVENKLKELNPDLIVHISGDILKENIYSIPIKGTINLHHGVLPYIRGLDSMYWGIYYKKESWVGATIHYIDDGVDTGEVILKRGYDYTNDKSLIETIVEIERLGTKLIISAINMIDNHTNLTNKNNQTSNIKSIYRSRAPIKVILVVLFKIFFQRFRYKNK